MNGLGSPVRSYSGTVSYIHQMSSWASFNWFNSVTAINGCQHLKGHFCTSILQSMYKLTLLHSDTSCAGGWIETRSDPHALHLDLLLRSSSAVQASVKISLVSGRWQQKQWCSPCQISPGVARDWQERALASGSSKF